MNKETIIDIVQSGLLAPSADNKHVFRYEVTMDSIDLWPSPEFAATDKGHHLVLGLISLGAVVENMRLRAALLGFATDIQWQTKQEDRHGMIARLIFRPSTPTIDGLALAIPDRHTNRNMYHGPALSDEELSSLTGEIDSIDGAQIKWLQGNARNRALALIWRAESERFLRQSLHQEIFSSIRFDLSWQQSSEWALPPGALGIETPMRPIFKALRHWPLMRVLNFVGLHRIVGLRAGWLPCWQAPSLAVLTTTLPVDKGAVAVGAALERFWLRATRLGLAMQPLAASVVLPFQTSANGGASDNLRLTLSSNWQGITPNATPMMVLRIGRSKRPDIRSGRLPMADYRLAPKKLA